MPPSVFGALAIAATMANEPAQTGARLALRALPVSGPVPWDRSAHTGAKHDIYRRYLIRWFPILLGGQNAFPSATYAEGFAGPGVYAGGEPGSPIIAMRALVEKVSDKPTVRFVLVDDDPRCVASLKTQFREFFPERPRSEATTKFTFVKGTCIEKLEASLDGVGAWGQPILAVLDSWGQRAGLGPAAAAAAARRRPRRGHPDGLLGHDPPRTGDQK